MIQQNIAFVDKNSSLLLRHVKPERSFKTNIHQYLLCCLWLAFTGIYLKEYTNYKHPPTNHACIYIIQFLHALALILTKCTREKISQDHQTNFDNHPALFQDLLVTTIILWHAPCYRTVQTKIQGNNSHKETR